MAHGFSTRGSYIQGGEILRQLEVGQAALRDGVAHITSRLNELEELCKENVQQRGDALLELAKLYLPELDRQAIESTFREVRSQLEELLFKKQRTRRKLQAEWDQTLDDRQQARVELDRLTEELDRLVEKREELEQRLADRLADNDEFQRLSTQTIAAEEQLDRDTQRVEESQQEAAEKLPAYENSRLFQYLIKRGYGSPQYKHRGFTKRWDKWIAKLVQFDRSKKSYDFLRVTPELMAAEVDRRRAEFEELMRQVESIEQQQSDELGLTDVLKEGMKAGKRRDTLVTRLEVEQEEQNQIEQQLKELDSNQGEFYEQAIERLKKFLGSMHESALEAKTRQTVGAEDDQLLHEIRWLNDRLDEARKETRDLQPQLIANRRRGAELASLARRFRRAEFDAQRSVFQDDFDARPHIQQFVGGTLSDEALWSLIQRNQKFLPNWSERQWEQRGGGQRRGGSGWDSEFSYLLMRVLAEAAGAAIRHAADRHRRGGFSQPPSVRRRARGGFTKGRGF